VSSYQFQPEHYGQDVAILLVEPRVMSLGPGTPVVSVQAQLERLALPKSCLAGLWLYFDFLDLAHSICQVLETPECNCWHAILHRREPDAWNSKYWWKRVGEHPVLRKLREYSPTLGYTFTTPERFVDFCESVRETGSAEEKIAQQVQILEWQLLFDHCYQTTIA
jgi:hypothetical protein